MATHPTANDDALQLSSYTKNPQVVAELLRLFLAALPEPLLTFQLYDSFLLTQTIQSPADRVWAYRFLLAYLPPGFRSSVKLLLTLLFNLSRNSEVNGMDANALASVFGPCFLRPEEELYYMKDDPPLVVQIVALLIQEYPPPLPLGINGFVSISHDHLIHFISSRPSSLLILPLLPSVLFSNRSSPSIFCSLRHQAAHPNFHLFYFQFLRFKSSSRRLLRDFRPNRPSTTCGSP